LVPFARMSAVIDGLLDLMVSRWAIAGAGHAINVADRLAGAPQIASLTGYSPSFFSLSETACAIILARLHRSDAAHSGAARARQRQADLS
jgi:hypothetical protein